MFCIILGGSSISSFAEGWVGFKTRRGTIGAVYSSNPKMRAYGKKAAALLRGKGQKIGEKEGPVRPSQAKGKPARDVSHADLSHSDRRAKSLEQVQTHEDLAEKLDWLAKHDDFDSIKRTARNLGITGKLASKAATVAAIKEKLAANIKEPERDPRILTSRPDLTTYAPKSLVMPSAARYLKPHQLESAANAIHALDTHGIFVLASGPGTGKTRGELAVAATMANLGRKVLIVSKAEVIKPSWKDKSFTGSFDDDSKAMGIDISLTNGSEALEPGKIQLTTFQNLGKFKDKIDKNTTIIFDESQAAKHLDSIRGRDADELSRLAGQTMFASATPADRPLDLVYIFRNKLFPNTEWADVKKELGVIEKEIGGDESPVLELAPGASAANCYQRLSGIFDNLTKEGMMLKHEISLDGVEMVNDMVELPEEAHKELADIEAKSGDPSERKNVLMTQRRRQEKHKIPHVLAHVDRELAAGRSVIVFGSVVTGDEGEEGTMETLRKALAARGIENVAELHGGTKMPAKQAMDDFQSGKARVLIGTLESGGTGVNLDDTVGDRPRTTILMTDSFSAIDRVQAMGRTKRLNTKSDPKFITMYANTKVDDWNRRLSSSKMKTLGAIIKGESEKLQFSEEKKSNGRWITIGANEGEDGKRRGGSPVFIEGGKITKGHPSLEGAKLKGLKEHSAWSRQAQKIGHDPKSVHQLAGEILAHDTAYKKDIHGLLKKARSAPGISNVHHKRLKDGGDYSSIKGFDVLARAMAGEYPHILGNHGYTSDSGYDKDADNASQKLYDLLKAGNPTPMGSDEAYQQAMEHLASVSPAPRSKREEDIVPFSEDRQNATAILSFLCNATPELISAFAEGKSGVFKDKLGRTYHLQNGKRVKGPTATAIAKPKAAPKAKAAPKRTTIRVPHGHEVHIRFLPMTSAARKPAAKKASVKAMPTAKAVANAAPKLAKAKTPAKPRKVRAKPVPIQSAAKMKTPTTGTFDLGAPIGKKPDTFKALAIPSPKQDRKAHEQFQKVHLPKIRAYESRTGKPWIEMAIKGLQTTDKSLSQHRAGASVEGVWKQLASGAIDDEALNRVLQNKNFSHDYGTMPVHHLKKTVAHLKGKGYVPGFTGTDSANRAASSGLVSHIPEAEAKKMYGFDPAKHDLPTGFSEKLRKFSESGRGVSVIFGVSRFSERDVSDEPRGTDGRWTEGGDGHKKSGMKRIKKNPIAEAEQKTLEGEYVPAQGRGRPKMLRDLTKETEANLRAAIEWHVARVNATNGKLMAADANMDSRFALDDLGKEMRRRHDAGLLSRISEDERRAIGERLKPQAKRGQEYETS